VNMPYTSPVSGLKGTSKKITTNSLLKTLDVARTLVFLALKSHVKLTLKMYNYAHIAILVN
jgi:hypothetical protein